MNDDVLLLAGLRGDSCTLPEQSKSGRIFQHQDRLWHSGEWSGMVCAPSTLLQLYIVPDRRQVAQQSRFAQGGFPGLFQHVWAYQTDPWQCHAASWRAHAIWLCQQPEAALPLHLPSDKRPGASTPDSMLRWRQQPSYYSAFLQGWSASWERLSWHTARSGQRQQTLWGEHLDVALRQGSPQDGVHRRGWKNQEWACQREQDQSSWDEEAAQRRGRLWGCRRQCRMNRQSMISFMISWYDAIISYTKSYYIKSTWNIYDIITEGMISYMITDMISSFYFIWYWAYLWYHTFIYDIIDNIIYMILCMILQYDITRQISWYCKWYHRQYHMIWSVLKNSMIS